MEPRSPFVIAEASIASAMVIAAVVLAVVAHLVVFAAVLLLVAGMAYGHALAVNFGLAHPPRENNRRGRRSPRG